MVPETWQGKLIASFCALLGISFFALPAVSIWWEKDNWPSLCDRKHFCREFWEVVSPWKSSSSRDRNTWYAGGNQQPHWSSPCGVAMPLTSTRCPWPPGKSTSIHCPLSNRKWKSVTQWNPSSLLLFLITWKLLYALKKRNQLFKHDKHNLELAAINNQNQQTNGWAINVDPIWNALFTC